MAINKKKSATKASSTPTAKDKPSAAKEAEAIKTAATMPKLKPTSNKPSSKGPLATTGKSPAVERPKDNDKTKKKKAKKAVSKQAHKSDDKIKEVYTDFERTREDEESKEAEESKKEESDEDGESLDLSDINKDKTGQHGFINHYWEGTLPVPKDNIAKLFAEKPKGDQVYQIEDFITVSTNRCPQILFNNFTDIFTPFLVAVPNLGPKVKVVYNLQQAAAHDLFVGTIRTHRRDY